VRPDPGSSRFMRILLNDYCGHPFQVELSRELARRGHEILHIYSADDQTPKGDLLPSDDTPPNLSIEGLSVGQPLQKYGNLFKRRSQERAYGSLMCRRVDAFTPDIVIGSNNPLEAQNRIGNHCGQRRIPFIFWLQDIHCDAIRSFLRQKSSVAGTFIGGWYERMEKRLLRDADHIVAIADSFRERLERWHIPASRITVIENWAPLEKIEVASSDNSWRRAHGLVEKRVALYSGTIGLKHNPDLLLAVADSLRAQADVRILVVSQGKYADYLRTEAERRQLGNLMVLPFQPFECYSEVLASGDVLLAMIEPDAAAYSVPSKVLSYLCSGRPIVLSADSRNLAAKTVIRAASGAVVDPRDVRGFIEAVKRFLDDEEQRADAGLRGRQYANETFGIARIADRFEAVIRVASDPTRRPVYVGTPPLTTAQERG
jgi:colanic acid biosynthesis glycosyl transferase WcaI